MAAERWEELLEAERLALAEVEVVRRVELLLSDLPRFARAAADSLRAAADSRCHVPRETR
ncbi:hypothetical protein [Candidatus Poriferisocius sp.]|uniref:hypothetical protein n=1 Tax=Candidatus Poriferisocius sp. TaxID=3101276 RepID=UPI003B517D72